MRSWAAAGHPTVMVLYDAVLHSEVSGGSFQGVCKEGRIDSTSCVGSHQWCLEVPLVCALLRRGPLRQRNTAPRSGGAVLAASAKPIYCICCRKNGLSIGCTIVLLVLRC